MISVLIPTKNEEADLPGCLRSVAWCDDVHVYDSGSTDRTTEIAQSLGARVTSAPNSTCIHGLFGGNEAEHKTWALRNLPFRHAWVLHLDADERPTPELIASAMAAVRQPTGCVAFRMQRRDFFRAHWLRHVQTTPFYIRLFRPDKMRYERLINPVSVPDGPVGQLQGYLDHHPFSKGLRHWLDRHNSYSTLEAAQIVANRKSSSGSFRFRDAFFERDIARRRFHQKELFYRLPARPLLKFTLLYLAKRGFLDGSAGLTYALLQSFYEYMICLKTAELSEI